MSTDDTSRRVIQLEDEIRKLSDNLAVTRRRTTVENSKLDTLIERIIHLLTEFRRD